MSKMLSASIAQLGRLRSGSGISSGVGAQYPMPLLQYLHLLGGGVGLSGH